MIDVVGLAISAPPYVLSCSNAYPGLNQDRDDLLEFQVDRLHDRRPPILINGVDISASVDESSYDHLALEGESQGDDGFFIGESGPDIGAQVK